MARSSRTSTASRRSARRNTRTATPAATVATPEREPTVRSARSIKNYTFEYQRDRVSRRAGASYFRLESNGGDSEVIQMTLQEAQSLYNFLGNALSR